MNGIEVLSRAPEATDAILTKEALEFIARLHRTFIPRRQELLAGRAERQKRFDAGELPGFLPETKAVRELPMLDAPAEREVVRTVPPAFERRRARDARPRG